VVDLELQQSQARVLVLVSMLELVAEPVRALDVMVQLAFEPEEQEQLIESVVEEHKPAVLLQNYPLPIA
jgi:hypothetical protein